MKFRNWFDYQLRNEADDMGGDAGGSDDSYVDDGGEVDTGDDELIGESWDDAFKDSGLDPKKYGLEEEEQVEAEEDEVSQGSEEGKETGQSTDEKSLLDRLNSLGMAHNEQPLKVESLEQVKELIQKGQDYTLKTQNLSEERKGWEAEKVQTETELNGAIDEFNAQYKQVESQLQELQQFKFALEHLQQTAPDVFEEVQRASKEIGDRFKNPIVEQQMAAMNKRLAEAESQLSAEKNKLVIDKFESEFSALSATEQSLKELGITVNKDDVKKHWAKSGLSVKEVMGSLYFEHVAKAQASKAKVEQTKAKVQAKPAGAASASRPGKKVQAIDPKLKGVALAEALWKRHTTK